MRLDRHSCRFAFVGVAAACWLSVAAFGSANAADYEVRTFEGGPGWFVYDEAVDIALHVLHPAEPKCHEIGEIILLFEARDQLRDDALIEAAALTGMNRYAELCRSLGANPSNQRKVAGLIVGAGAPDRQGRIMGNARVLDAMVSSLTGEYQLTVRQNAAAVGDPGGASAATAVERDQKLAAQQAERKAADRARAEQRSKKILITHLPQRV